MQAQPILMSLREAIQNAKNRIAELRQERGVIDDEITTLEQEIETCTAQPVAEPKPKRKRKCGTCGEWLRQCTCNQPVVADDRGPDYVVNMTPETLTVADAACEE